MASIHSALFSGVLMFVASGVKIGKYEGPAPEESPPTSSRAVSHDQHNDQHFRGNTGLIRDIKETLSYAMEHDY